MNDKNIIKYMDVVLEKESSEILLIKSSRDMKYYLYRKRIDYKWVEKVRKF